MSGLKRAGLPAPRHLMFNRFYEFERVISKVVITEEGTFKEGEVPEGYGGARLELDIVDAVFLVNSRTEMHMFEFANAEAMDAERKTGGPVIRDGVEIAPQTGESTVPTVQTTVRNPTLEESRALSGEVAKAAFAAELTLTPGQPKS